MDSTAGELRPAAAAPRALARDPHSVSRPDQTRVTHLALDLEIDFARQRLDGSATLTIENLAAARQLVLDTRDLEIHSVHLDRDREPARFELGPPAPFLGRPLIIHIEPGTELVRIEYSTLPQAAALQWLTPRQTAGGGQPMLFTQSQSIYARTWVPCQDTPTVRMTFEATIRTPRELLAVMGAENPVERSGDGVYRFRMPQAIPSYLLALCVGDLEFCALGPRSGVYAEPSLVDKAAWEFADTERMLAAAEALYGPYLWGRYDLLVLPPSFPFGGMENPRLTFVHPTILTGDRSLVTLVAHELAHSWSGNLVTNATWNDFWLNEGFTNYFENRIMEAVHGRDFSEMLAALQHQSLRATLKDMGPDNLDTCLHLDLDGRDPEDGVNDIAYEKGFFFVRSLEEKLGRARFDAFLRGYFERFAFQSMDTERFVGYLNAALLSGDAGRAAPLPDLDLEAWIHSPGLPASSAPPPSEALAAVSAAVRDWNRGAAACTLPTERWATQHWLYFINSLPPSLPAERLSELDDTFKLTATGNSEILFAWLKTTLRDRYSTPAVDTALERFLTTVGRRRFIVPLYKELARTPAGFERAQAIYARARPGYHPAAAAAVEQVLLHTSD